jgi:glycosyltransferase involved in cell wall biosynthesis
VGWSWTREIARFHEVWVITRTNNREAIESAQTIHPLANVHWVYLDLPRWARFWKKGQRGIHAYYFLWQIRAYFAARKLHRKIGIDLIHHVTLGIYWIPSFLPLLPVPFVWGPVGGGESAPRPFWHTFSLRGKFYEVFRNLGRVTGNLNPMVRLNARRAVVALSKSMDTKKQLESLGAQRVLVYSEVGLPAVEIHRLKSSALPQHDMFRLVSVGSLLHLKGFEFGIRAFALFHSHFANSEYWVIGEGPERKRLQNLARKLGIGDSVHFLGSMSRTQVLTRLVQCDVLVHPSLHDSGGWTCIEAMAAGRPVICLDLGGPAFQVTEQTGIKIPALSPRQVIKDLAAALNRLSDDPLRRQQLGNTAQERVAQHFSWDAKRSSINCIYSSAQHGTVKDKY